jgi:hypothetical protein
MDSMSTASPCGLHCRDAEYRGKTAGPSTVLRSGRDDKGRAVTSRKIGDFDGQS